MKSPLRTVIEEVLKDVHIETGDQSQWDDVVNRLEAAISAKILSHEIDYYSVQLDA